MPYFIYKISDNHKALDKIESHAAFKDAKTRARQMRAELAPDADSFIKIIFAETAEAAEVCLREKRTAPVLKEWEK